MPEIAIALLVLFALGGIPAWIAVGKGRDLALWWTYGTLFFLIALIHALCLRPTAAEKARRATAAGLVPCGDCLADIPAAAKRCRYCGSEATARA